MTAAQELDRAAGKYELSHLRSLEAEAIHIIREVAAEFEKPVLLFSGGKDSIVMLHLALKAFRPGRLPFPVMHVDTGHNFDEVLEVRDELVAESGVRLVVAKVQDDIDAGPRRRDHPVAQPDADLHAAACHPREQVRRRLRRRPPRRGEGPRQGARVQLPRRVRPVGPQGAASRAVEPVQRAPPQGRAHPGVPDCPTGPSSTSGPTSAPRRSSCRRSTTRTSARSSSATACCWPCTSTCSRARTRRSSRRPCGSAPSATSPAPAASNRSAGTVSEVIAETAVSRLTERGATRADDRISEAGMEDRKREGYF